MPLDFQSINLGPVYFFSPLPWHAEEGSIHLLFPRSCLNTKFVRPNVKANKLLLYRILVNKYFKYNEFNFYRLKI